MALPVTRAGVGPVCLVTGGNGYVGKHLVRRLLELGCEVRAFDLTPFEGDSRITSIVGVIMAYVNRSDAPQWLESHYRFQIRTFWIGMLYGFISMLLTSVVIGFALLLLVLVWWIVRCVKGMRALGERKPVENVESWMF